MLMKKLYATIFASLFCSAAIMAQEEHSLVFVQNDQVLANGATLTISDVEYEDCTEFAEFVGGNYGVEMNPRISVRNNEATKVSAVMDCDGIGANYKLIEFCFGNCYAWGDETHLSSTQSINAGKDLLAMIHIGGIYIDEKNFSVSDASVKLTLYPATDPDDKVTLTLVFDTTDASTHAIKEQKSIEVYNLCGKQVATSTVGLPKGIYIVRHNGVSRKMTIK